MPEPQIAQKAPFSLDVRAGRKYFWCACGLSRKQPLCDGSHAGTGIVPMLYEARIDDTVWFCGCKASGDKPFCDGTHHRL